MAETPRDPLVATEIRDDIAILTLNRPAALNALGRDGDGEAIETACDALNRNQAVRCIIMTGAGKAFSAGGDLKALQSKEGMFAGDALQIRDGYRRNVHRIARAIYGLELPVIAAVNGAAIGLGCDIACMADIRIASDRAVFGVTFLKLGLIPGDGGAWLLPKIIGMSQASELLFTGRIVDAPTALSLGLVSRIAVSDQLLDQAFELARQIAMQPPQALRLAKSLLRHGQASSYDTLLEMSSLSQAICHTTVDHAEGVDAILSRRRPEFRGR